MGARTFLQSARRLFHVAQKPDWEETALLIKISLIGVGIVGGIGFVIRILFWLVGLYNLPQNQTSPYQNQRSRLNSSNRTLHSYKTSHRRTQRRKPCGSGRWTLPRTARKDHARGSGQTRSRDRALGGRLRNTTHHCPR